MKRWIDRVWAKAAAYVLALLFTALTVLGGVGIVVLAEANAFLDGGAALTEQVYSATCREYIYRADSYMAGVLADAGVIYGYEYAETDYAGTGGDELLRKLPSDFADEFTRDSTPCHLRVLVDGQVFAENFTSPAGETLYHTTVTFTHETQDGDELVYTIEGDLLDMEPLPSYELLLAYWLARHVGLTVFLTVLSAVLALACVIFLMAFAGHWQGREGIHLTWFDRIPLDLSLCAAVLAACGLYDAAMSELVLPLMLAVLYAPLFLSAFAAQCKAGAVLRSTLIARICRLLWRILRGVWRGMKRTAAALPLVWKTALVSAALVVLELFCIDSGGLYLLVKALEVAAVLYIAVNLRVLQKGGEKLADGDYTQSINTRFLIGDFKRYGQRMNDLRSGMERAVQEQTRAERMKTELITNVSHDIKTPLTSIVNYVDLLQKEDVSPETAQEYIAVLDRQSRRLKKLTEDLVEASKASSGALPVDLQPTDVGVLFSQITGEYEERLADCHLTLIAKPPRENIRIMADSKLLSRVMDNLVSNVCKYALPDTRVYVTAEEREGNVTLSFKNVSRAELNISPEELMERFVRGDTSRHTEGSGLGLSIAQSLVELQGGTFGLNIDADLFRADVTFPVME